MRKYDAMSLFSVLLSALYILAALWAVLHIAACLLLPRTPRVPLSYYPPPADHSPLFVTESALFLCFRTTRLNARADALAHWFARDDGRRWARVARAQYTVGGAFAAFGMLKALKVLTETAVRLAGIVLERWTGTDAVVDAVRVWKRGDVVNTVTAQRPGHGIPVYAIIPGVTVPLSHLSLLIGVLISSQVIHELGHFIAAALEDVPILTVGFSVTVLIPSAFVALSQGALCELPALARLRVASSGAYHNLALYSIFALVTRASFLTMPGYQDVSAWGRVVLYIPPGSPLEGHLPVGAIVTKIDDDMLSSAPDHSQLESDMWAALLSRPDVRKDTNEEEWLGWCVDRRWFVDQSTACCLPNSITPTIASTTISHTQTSCFVAYPPLALERCVDPVPYLGDPVESPVHARCGSAVECGTENMCMRPRDDQALLRLTVHLPAWLSLNGQPTDRIVVWNGPRYEILGEVEVTTYAPRLSFLPLSLPSLLAAFMSYFMDLNFSLFLFNILPLSFLDGAPCFSALYDIVALACFRAPASPSDTLGGHGETHNVELVALEGGGSLFERWQMRFDARARWKRRLERVVHLVSAGLVGACVILGVLVGMSG